MKVQVVVASMLVSGLAFGATVSTSATKNVKKSDKIVAKAGKKKSVTVAQNSSSNASQKSATATTTEVGGTVAHAAAATTMNATETASANDKVSTSLTAAKQAAAPKKWGAYIDHNSYFDSDVVNTGDIGAKSNPSTLTVFGVKYKFGNKESISLSQRVDADLVKAQYYANQTYATYMKGEVLKDVAAGIRVGAATGPGNADKSLVAYVSPRAMMEKSLGKVKASVNLLPYFWASSQASYVKSNGKTVANYYAWLFGYAAVEYNFTDKFKIYQNLGENYQLSRQDGPATADSSDKKFLYAETAVSYAFNDYFTATIGIQDFWNYDLGSASFALYPDRAGQTQYFFNGSVTF